MSAYQASFPIATMARVLGVLKAGYYAWLRRSPSAHAAADTVLLKRIRTIHVTRIHAELRAKLAKVPRAWRVECQRREEGRSMGASALPG